MESTYIKRIRDLREDHDKIQKEIADMMGISQSYISRLEKRILEKLKAEFMKLE